MDPALEGTEEYEAMKKHWTVGEPWHIPLPASLKKDIEKLPSKIHRNAQKDQRKKK